MDISNPTMERHFKLKDEALDIFLLVVAEWKSDPMSVQCFDLRIVDKAIKIEHELKQMEKDCPWL